MIVFHYSQTLKEGDRLEPDFQKYRELCDPFTIAMTHSRDCLFSMILNGKYMFAVLDRSNLRYWADYAKWATEGIFEYVRLKEYSKSVSRIHCCYYCTDLSECIRMYHEDWDEEEETEKSKVRLFEVEIPNGSLEKRDISLFDAAYDAIKDSQDIDAAIEYARKYYAGEHNAEPVWEYLSAGEAVAVHDITHVLYI